MKCPKCGYRRQPKDNTFVPATECPACGVVYAQAENGPVASARAKRFNAFGGSSVPGIFGPSPVDEMTLKQARERVEQRLRNQLSRRMEDERRHQTLQRARRIVQARMQARLAKPVDVDDAIEPTTEAMAPLPTAPEETVAAVTQPQPLDIHQTTDEAAPSTPAEAGPSKDEPPVETQRNRGAKMAAETEARQEDKTVDPGHQPSAATITPAETDRIKPLPDHKDRRQAAAHQNLSAAEPSGDEMPPDHNAGILNKRKAAGTIAQRRRNWVWGATFAKALPAVAWTVLIIGIVGAGLSWATIGKVTPGVGIAHGAVGAVNPLGLLLGLAYLAIGVLGFAFFWMAGLLTRHLSDIRTLLIRQSHLPLVSGTADQSAASEPMPASRHRAGR